MLIQDLDIPYNLKQRYSGAGISELYPPQTECVEKGILAGKNTLVAIPTASGKTLIAEMAMHNAIKAGGKCLYIVPLKALAGEKYAFGPRHWCKRTTRRLRKRRYVVRL